MKPRKRSRSLTENMQQMRQTLVFFSFVLLPCMFAHAQEMFYDFFKPGNFHTGFQDTLIYDPGFEYTAYNYHGKKPFFIQIWHPAAKRTEAQPEKETRKPVCIKDLLEFKCDSSLEIVRQQLQKNNREILIRDFIAENVKTGEANDFGALAYEDIFHALTGLKTQSFYSPVKTGSDFPVIVYHHGSQSNSFENFAMAEYFASRGFIFVAANFHLPYENSMWGLKPYDKLIQNEDEAGLRTVMQFAQTLSKSPFIFFIGHSLGAQMGFRTFDSDSTVQGMISLETTIEFQNDSQKIRELWPEVFHKLVTEKAHYPFPVLLCAAVGKEGSFNLLEHLNTPQLFLASTKSEFEHNAYISLFYLRYFLDPSIEQTDKTILKDRLNLYVKHLDLMHEFLIRAMKNEPKEDRESRIHLE